MSAELEEKVTSSLVGGKLPCPVAFKITEEGGNRREIGRIVDELGIMISGCQLGCFEAKKATHSNTGSIDIDRALAEEVKASLLGGQLPCPVAFQVAKKFKVVPKEVGKAANRLKIRIVGCQLGCFP